MSTGSTAEPDAGSTTGTGPWLVLGLGNPGPAYADHRHNIGHMVVDELAGRVAAAAQGSSGAAERGGRLRGLLGRRTEPKVGWRGRGRADVYETHLGPPPSRRVVLAKPRSYMNLSGEPAAALAAFYKSSPDRLIVVHDEIDLPFETVRLKLGGGDNGHNGLRSIRRSLGTGDFHRVRFGVGRPPGRQDAADYVLSPFSSTERKELPLAIVRAADAVELLVIEGLTAAQNAFHGA